MFYVLAYTIEFPDLNTLFPIPYKDWFLGGWAFFSPNGRHRGPITGIDIPGRMKQFDNVVREANGELNLLNSKKAGLRDYLPPKQIVDCVNVTELERDLELERRKVRELQDAARERDKEYAKLKAQLDKFKRKTLLGPASGNENATPAPNSFFDDQRTKPRQTGNTVANSSPPSQTNGQPEDFVPLFQDSK
uniref:Uncharacterized protein n=1 Tax=Psilocybe cubensis TaxID=181762 RepID=A0A8H8CKS0_PSICU